MTKQDIEYNKNLEKLDNKTTKLEKAIAHIEYLENVLSCIDYEVFLFQRGRQEAEETLDEIHKLAEEAQDIDWERENVYVDRFITKITKPDGTIEETLEDADLDDREALQQIDYIVRRVKVK